MLKTKKKQKNMGLNSLRALGTLKSRFKDL